MAVRRSPKPFTGVRFLGRCHRGVAELVDARASGARGTARACSSPAVPTSRIKPQPGLFSYTPATGGNRGTSPRLPGQAGSHTPERVGALPKGKLWSSADLTGNQARLTLRASRESFLDTRPSSAYKAHRPASPRPWIHGPVLESSQSPPSVHRPGDHITRLGRRSHCILFL